MATKTANVTARIQPNIKEQAEAILERLGIPVSVFIDMTYRQARRNGLESYQPFSGKGRYRTECGRNCTGSTLWAVKG